MDDLKKFLTSVKDVSKGAKYVLNHNNGRKLFPKWAWSPFNHPHQVETLNKTLDINYLTNLTCENRTGGGGKYAKYMHGGVLAQSWCPTREPLETPKASPSTVRPVITKQDLLWQK